VTIFWLRIRSRADHLTRGERLAEGTVGRGSQASRVGVLCRAGLSSCLATMGAMSELPAEDTHDMIHRGGQVVAVVVPIEEYRQLRLAQEEERINKEFAAAYADHLARKEAGTVQYVSHEEARRRLGMPGQ
jgi:hypothetical protein